MTPAALRALIDASGLTVREWAACVAGRDPRTVQRWLAGEAIPSHARDWLARLESVTPAAPRAVVVVVRIDRTVPPVEVR